MSYQHMVRKALEYDLEEIRLLSMAAGSAPPAVAQQLLGVIMEEVKSAHFWNTLLTCCYDRMPYYPDPGYHPPGDCYPYQKGSGQTKEEGSK